MKKICLIILILFIILIQRTPLTAGIIDCSNVQHISKDSLIHNQIANFIVDTLTKRHDEPGCIEIRAIDQMNDWYIVEAEFKNLEPAIFVLHKIKDTYKMVTLFGGSTAPEEPAPIIRKYFIEKVPNAPKELFNCYTPKSYPFIKLSD